MQMPKQSMYKQGYKPGEEFINDPYMDNYEYQQEMIVDYIDHTPYNRHVAIRIYEQMLDDEQRYY